MQSWQHSGFKVWAGSPIAYSDTASLKFLARYLKKAPLSNQRIELLEEANTVRYSKSSAVSKTYRDFEPLQFLAEITQHIPNKWEHTTRYFGLYSARTRGATKNKEALITNSVSLSNPDLQTDKPKPSKTWVACMKLVFEFDPLLCPKCGAIMKIKSFITQQSEIKRLCDYHKLPAWRAPPVFKIKTPIQTCFPEFY